MSGTSMAAPQMTGAAAVLRQYANEKLPGISVVTKMEVVNNLLMSISAPIVEATKDGVSTYYSPRKQGSGLVNVYDAINSGAYLYTGNNGRPKAEMGSSTEGADLQTLSYDFYVDNTAPEYQGYTFTVDGDNTLLKLYASDDHSAQGSFLNIALDSEEGTSVGMTVDDVLYYAEKLNTLGLMNADTYEALKASAPYVVSVGNEDGLTCTTYDVTSYATFAELFTPYLSFFYDGELTVNAYCFGTSTIDYAWNSDGYYLVAMKGEVTVKVVDDTGKAVRKAVVEIDGKEYETNKDGQVSLEKVVAGSHQVTLVSVPNPYGMPEEASCTLEITKDGDKASKTFIVSKTNNGKGNNNKAKKQN